MKYATILLISVLILQSIAISAFEIVEEKNENIISLFISTSEPTIKKIDSFSKIIINEAETYFSLPGYPSLPIIKKTFILPYGSEINKVIYSNKDAEIITLSEPIQPSITPAPISSKLSNPTYEPNEIVYSNNKLYPEQQYDIQTGTGLKDGKLVHFVNIQYYPIQYNPVQNRITWTKQSWINISYKEAKETSLLNNEYDLVIIGPQQFQSEIQNLVNHKNSNGINTIFKSTNEIYSNYQGRDNAEKIKYFIYNTLKTYGIKNVLLIGNIDLLPMRRAAIQIYHDSDVLTDLYYSDVLEGTGQFSDWDSNNNDKFSEYSWDKGCIDFVDAYPDLNIGRLPCKNSKEVRIVVNKIITYEAESAHEPWYKRMLLLAGDTFPNHGVIEGELVTNIIGQNMQQHGFEIIKLWTSMGNYKPLNINQEITNGVGFISYSGHGYEQGFGTSPPNVEDRIEYYSPYLYGVFNGNKLPVLFFDACSTTKLDFNIEELLVWYPQPIPKILAFINGIEYDMDSYYPCISWELVKKTNGGTIACIGATRVAFTGVGEDGAHWGAGFLNTHFFKHYSTGKSLGDLFSGCQVDYLNSVGKEFITLEEFNLIGDPSLALGGI